MGQSLTHKIIGGHLVEGEMVPGKDIALQVDQCLIQDATGAMVWLQFDQLGLPRVTPRLVVQYVDHNMTQDSLPPNSMSLSRGPRQAWLVTLVVRGNLETIRRAIP